MGRNPVRPPRDHGTRLPELLRDVRSRHEPRPRGKHHLPLGVPDAHDAYVRRLQEELAGTVWAHPSVRRSWYKGPDGNVYVLSPWRLVDYWTMTKWPEFEDYVVA